MDALRARLRELRGPIYGTKAELWARVVEYTARRELEQREHQWLAQRVEELQKGHEPVEVRVQGAPRGPQLLEPEEDLVVADLPQGTWRLSVQWHGKSVVRRETLELDDGLRRMLDLPLEAIEGQSPEERSRAGR